MSEIKVPVSAPGAVKAATEVDKLADSLQKVADKHKKVLTEEEKTAKMQASVDRQIKANAERWDQYSKSLDGSRQMAVRGREEFNRLQKSMADSSMTNRAQKKLLRMVPGGNLIDDVGDMMEGAGSARLGVALGALVASFAGAAVLFRANSKRIEENNKATEERTRLDFALARASKSALDAQQDRAAGGFRSIKGAARSILNVEGRQGEGVVRDLLQEGGADAVKAMAELLKGRGRGGKMGGMTGAGLLDEARTVQGVTGMDLEEILKEMEKGKGRYSREKLIKSLTGVGSEMLGVTGESGRDTDLSDLIDDVDKRERQLNRAKGGQMLDRSLVLPAIDREIIDVIDPMRKIITAHNEKIQEEIEVRSALLVAERNWLDWWVEASPKMQATFEALGVRSTAGQAGRDVNRLSKNLR
jgi:hypothetical protein